MNTENKKLNRIEKKLLHYTGKAIFDYKMIKNKDRVLVCLSGGKDSFTMLSILKLLQMRSKIKFEIFVFVLNQSSPNWDPIDLENYLKVNKIPYEIVKKNIYEVVREKIPENKSYCSLCSRLRRGNIYKYARDNNFNKIALGHHRDDLIQTLLMSIFYSGEIKSMPPKYLTDDKQHVVIRPLAYCQEKDIIQYAKLKEFPTVTCDSYCVQENLVRNKTANLIKTLASDNPKIPSNILHALQKVVPSHLMDKNLFNFDDF